MPNFNLTAALNVVGPFELNKILGDIKKDLSNAATVGVSLHVDKTALTELKADLAKISPVINVKASFDATSLSDIKKQLGAIGGEVKLRVSATDISSINTLKSSVDSLNTSLGGLSGNLLASTKNLSQLGSTANHVAGVLRNVAQVNNQINKTINNKTRNASTSGSRGSSVQSVDPKLLAQLKAVQGELAPIQQGFFSINKEVEQFGQLSGVLLKRFAGFTLASSAIFGLGRAFTNALSEAIDFQDELVKISQTTGLTLTTLSGLSKEVSRLGSDLGVSSKELLTASKTLAQAGLSAGEVQKSLESIAKASLAPSFKDINSITQTSISVIKQFGFSAHNLGSALSQINVLSRDSAIEAEELSSAIRRAGSSFNVAADQTLSAEKRFQQFLSIITAVKDKTGEAVESIATGTKTIFARIQRPELIERLKRPGINIDLEEDVKDKHGNNTGEKKFIGAFAALEKLNKALFVDKQKLDGRITAGILQDLGGVRELEKTIPLIQQYAEIQKNYEKLQKGSNSISEDAVTAQQSLAVQFAKTSENFKSLVKELSESDAFTGTVTKALQLANAFIEIARSIKPVIPLLAAVAGALAIKNTISFVGGLSSGIKSISRIPSLSTASRPYAKGGLVDAVLTPGEAIFSPAQSQKIGKAKLDRWNNTGDNQGIGLNGAMIVPGVGNSDTVNMKLPVGSYVLKKSSLKKKFAEGNSVDQATLLAQQKLKAHAIFESLKKNGIDVGGLPDFSFGDVGPSATASSYPKLNKIVYNDKINLSDENGKLSQATQHELTHIISKRLKEKSHAHSEQINTVRSYGANLLQGVEFDHPNKVKYPTSNDFKKYLLGNEEVLAQSSDTLPHNKIGDLFTGKVDDETLKRAYHKKLAKYIKSYGTARQDIGPYGGKAISTSIAPLPVIPLPPIASEKDEEKTQSNGGIGLPPTYVKPPNPKKGKATSGGNFYPGAGGYGNGGSGSIPPTVPNPFPPSPSGNPTGSTLVFPSSSTSRYPSFASGSNTQGSQHPFHFGYQGAFPPAYLPGANSGPTGYEAGKLYQRNPYGFGPSPITYNPNHNFQNNGGYHTNSTFYGPPGGNFQAVGVGHNNIIPDSNDTLLRRHNYLYRKTLGLDGQPVDATEDFKKQDAQIKQNERRRAQETVAAANKRASEIQNQIKTGQNPRKIKQAGSASNKNPYLGQYKAGVTDIKLKEDFEYFKHDYPQTGKPSPEQIKAYTNGYLKNFATHGDRNRAYFAGVRSFDNFKGPNLSVERRNSQINRRDIAGAKNVDFTSGTDFNIKQQSVAARAYTKALKDGASKVQAFSVGIQSARAEVPTFKSRLQKFGQGIISGFTSSVKDENGRSISSKTYTTKVRPSSDNPPGGGSGDPPNPPFGGNTVRRRRYGFGNTRKGFSGIGNRLGGIAANPTALFIASPTAGYVGDALSGGHAGESTAGGILSGAFAGAGTGSLLANGHPAALAAGAIVGGVTGAIGAQRQKELGDAERALTSSTKLLAESFEKLTSKFDDDNIAKVHENLSYQADKSQKLFSIRDNQKFRPNILGIDKAASFITNTSDGQKEGADRAYNKLGFFGYHFSSAQTKLKAANESKLESVIEEASQAQNDYGGIKDFILQKKLRNKMVDDSDYEKFAKQDIGNEKEFFKQGLRLPGREDDLQKARIQYGQSESDKLITNKIDVDNLLKLATQLENEFSFANQQLEFFGRKLEQTTTVMGISQEKLDKAINSSTGSFSGHIGQVANPFSDPAITSGKDLNKGFSSLKSFYGDNDVTQQIQERVNLDSVLEKKLGDIFQHAISEAGLAGSEGSVAGIVRNEIEKDPSLKLISGQAYKLAQGIEQQKQTSTSADFGRDALQAIKGFKRDNLDIAAEQGKKAFDHVIDVYRAHAASYEKVTQTLINQQNHRIAAETLAAEREVHIAELSGKHLSIAEHTAPEEKIIRGLTERTDGPAFLRRNSGTIDPQEIGRRIEAERKNRDDLFGQKQRLLENNPNSSITPEYQKLSEALTNSSLKLNKYEQALNKLATSTTKMTAIQNKLSKIDGQRAAQRGFLDKLTNATLHPQNALDFNKGIEGAAALLGHGQITHENFDHGKDTLLQVAEALGGDFKTEVEAKIAQVQTQRLIAGGLPPDVAKKLAEIAVQKQGGSAPEIKLLGELKDASDEQVKALREQARLMAQPNLLIETNEVLNKQLTLLKSINDSEKLREEGKKPKSEFNFDDGNSLSGLQKKAMGGTIRPLRAFANGGINAMVMPGEAIYSPEQVRKIGKHKLDKWNNGGKNDGISLDGATMVPGSGNSDSVPANLENGSYVVRKSRLKGFADGGPVNPLKRLADRFVNAAAGVVSGKDESPDGTLTGRLHERSERLMRERIARKEQESNAAQKRNRSEQEDEIQHFDDGKKVTPYSQANEGSYEDLVLRRIIDKNKYSKEDYNRLSDKQKQLAQRPGEEIDRRAGSLKDSGINVAGPAALADSNAKNFDIMKKAADKKYNDDKAKALQDKEAKELEDDYKARQERIVKENRARQRKELLDSYDKTDYSGLGKVSKSTSETIPEIPKAAEPVTPVDKRTENQKLLDQAKSNTRTVSPENQKIFDEIKKQNAEREKRRDRQKFIREIANEEPRVGEGFLPVKTQIDINNRRFKNKQLPSEENQKLLDQAKSNVADRERRLKEARDERAHRSGSDGPEYHGGEETKVKNYKTEAERNANARRINPKNYETEEERNARIRLNNPDNYLPQAERAAKVREQKAGMRNAARFADPKPVQPVVEGEESPVQPIQPFRPLSPFQQREENYRKKQAARKQYNDDKRDRRNAYNTQKQQDRLNRVSHSRSGSSSNGAFDPTKRFRMENGTYRGFANGGGVGVDSTLAMVAPGEFVVNKRDAQKHGAFLEHLNSGGKIPKFWDGGWTDGKLSSKRSTAQPQSQSRSKSGSNLDTSAFKELAEAMGKFDTATLAKNLADFTSQIKSLAGITIKVEVAPIQMVHSGHVEVTADSLKGEYDKLKQTLAGEMKKHINPLTGETKESYA